VNMRPTIVEAFSHFLMVALASAINGDCGSHLIVIPIA
jgi:hypothetical protein